jgi:hypothetical protein
VDKYATYKATNTVNKYMISPSFWWQDIILALRRAVLKGEEESKGV